jgi:hypothetical protein
MDILIFHSAGFADQLFVYCGREGGNIFGDSCHDYIYEVSFLLLSLWLFGTHASTDRFAAVCGFRWGECDHVWVHCSATLFRVEIYYHQGAYTRLSQLLRFED